MNLRWLSKLPDPTAHKKSTLSGKDMPYSVKEYCKDAKWISFDKIDYTIRASRINRASPSGLQLSQSCRFAQ